MRGIYKITNKTNNKIYIGESLDIIRRWSEHIEDLNNNKHHSYKLQKDWDIYGEDNFVFKIVSVLDDSIETYIDRYILLIYEYKYILKYNSIEDGYNIEKTLNEVINGNKIIDNKKDTTLIKKYINKVKDNIINEKGGIIYRSEFMMKDIINAVNLDTMDKLKSILFNYKFTIKKGSTYILNKSIFNKNHIICNDNFSDIKINEKLYFKLVNEINKIINSGDVNYSIVDKKENEIIKTKNYNYKPVPNTIKDFLKNYTLTISYNKVFEFLRNNHILEYRDYKGQKMNYPTNEYEDCFTIEEAEKQDTTKYIRLILTDKGKEIIYDVLVKNSFIKL